jgi:outer membrane cobalamin receptor
MVPCFKKTWISFVKALLLTLLLCLFCHESWSAESLDSFFELTLEELMQIKVITASKTIEPQAEAPSVMSVVTAKEIERFGATSLMDVLERVTSIHGFTSGLSRNVLLVRGDYFNASTIHLLVLINGRPTRERTRGGTEMDLFAMFI